ncbi:MAG: ABC transporter permease, partial [Nitrospira sp.]
MNPGSYEIFIGLRYLRAKRRNRTISLNTFVSVAGITLGVAALIGTLGIMTGFKEDLQAKILGTTSHIVVQERAREGMTNYEAIASQVERIPHVVAATPFIYRQVMLTSRSAVQGIVVRVIDPKREIRVTDLGKNIVVGKLDDLESAGDMPTAPIPPQPAAGALPRSLTPPGMALGKELALRLGVTVGDSVNVVSPVGSDASLNTMLMTPKIRTFKVAAIFQSGMYEYDSSLAYLSLAEAQKFFNLPGAATGIEVKVDDIFQAVEIAQDIEHSLGVSYWARDWMQLNRNLFAALKLEKTMMF